MKKLDNEPWEALKRSLLAIFQWLAIALAALVVLEMYTTDALKMPTRACIDVSGDPQ